MQAIVLSYFRYEQLRSQILLVTQENFWNVHMITTPNAAVSTTAKLLVTIMSNSSVTPAQDLLTAQELVRAIVAARQNVKGTPPPDEILSHRESLGIHLRTEVGDETQFIFANTIACFKDGMDSNYPIDKHLGLSIPHRPYDINTTFPFASQIPSAAARKYAA
jgi:hypothetical protein